MFLILILFLIKKFTEAYYKKFRYQKDKLKKTPHPSNQTGKFHSDYWAFIANIRPTSRKKISSKQPNLPSKGIRKRTKPKLSIWKEMRGNIKSRKHQ